MGVIWHLVGKTHLDEGLQDGSLIIEEKKPWCSLVLTAFEASTTIFKRHCPVLRVETNLTLALLELVLELWNLEQKHVNVTVTFDEIMCCCCNHLCSHLESMEPLFFVSSFLGPRGPLVLPSVGPSVLSALKILITYIQAYCSFQSNRTLHYFPLSVLRPPSVRPFGVTSQLSSII